MIRSTVRWMIFGALAITLAACSAGSTSSSGKTVVVTPAIRGNSASLAVGDTLVVQIPTIPTAGFEWVAQNLDTAILTQEGQAEYVASTDPNSAGGVVTLSFEAVAPGQTTLNLLYVSSPSGNLPGLSSNSLSVTVDVK